MYVCSVLTATTCNNCLLGETIIEVPIGCDGEPNSGKVIDVCGVCNGPGFPAGKCNCNGDTVDECGFCGGSGIPTGKCNCGGDVADECGVCGGDGLSCAGCDSVANSGKVVDLCGVCDGGGIASGTCNCNGDVLDQCGVCTKVTQIPSITYKKHTHLASRI